MACFGTGLTQSHSIYASGMDIGSINSSFCLALTLTLKLRLYTSYYIIRCDGCIVIYGRSFSLPIYSPNAKCTGHKSKGKSKDVYYISTVCLTGSG